MRRKSFFSFRYFVAVLIVTGGVFMPTRTGYMKIYMSIKTQACIREDYKQAIEKWSKVYKVEKALINAIGRRESGGNPLAIRVEPHLKRASWYKRALRGIEYIEDYHYCSFGKLQIMFGTARHIGYLGKPFGLFNPDKNIKFGTKLLRNLTRRYKGNIQDVIAAYNQGNNRFFDINKNGIKDDNEVYRNQGYVDEVYGGYKHYGGVL